MKTQRTFMVFIKIETVEVYCVVAANEEEAKSKVEMEGVTPIARERGETTYQCDTIERYAEYPLSDH